MDKMEDEKPRLDSQTIIDDLTAICNSLGKMDENDGTYMKDRDCKSCLKEMLRYLNADSDEHTARVTLGSFNIIKSDLIPLMVQYCDFNEGDPDMFTTILRLCGNLTTSISVLFQKKEPSNEPEFLKLQHELLRGLIGFKEAFASDDAVWSTLNVHLRHNEDDEITFERLVILIRNILDIPIETTDDLRMPNSFDAHEMCLHRMNRSGMMDTLIRIAGESSKGMEYCFHLTEIIYLMLRNQNPETVARSKPEMQQKKFDESDIDKKRLAELSARNKRSRQSENLNALRFRNGVRFIVQNRRSTGDNPIIVHKLLRDRETITFDAGKTELRKAKNRKPISLKTSIEISNMNTKSSKLSYGLRTFCQQFVEKIYNNYMQQIKYNLIQKRAQDDDESYYLWMIQFFTAFTRHMGLNIDYISETLSTSSLHFIQILITNHQDKLKIEKKNFHEVSRRLHLAIRAYREILLLLKSIDSDSPFFQTAKTIKKNIFTENEYSSLLTTLFQQYDEPKHSVLYLEDLIVTNSIFLELLDSFNCEIDNNQEAEQSGTPPKKRGKKFDYRTAGFMMRYCCPDVLKAHVTILKKFKNNSDELNLAILKFFERIVYDCKSENFLFQISIFKCLTDIVDYNSTLPGYDRFKSIAYHLFESFGALANRKRWLFQDILFWTLGEGVNEPEESYLSESQKKEPENEEGDKEEAEGELGLPNDYPLSDLQAELGLSDEDSLPSLGAESPRNDKSQPVDQLVESDNAYPLADLQAELEMSDGDPLPSLHDELEGNSQIQPPSPQTDSKSHEEKSSSPVMIDPTVANEPAVGMSDQLDTHSDEEISNA